MTILARRPLLGRVPRSLPATALMVGSAAVIGSAAGGRQGNAAWFSRLHKPGFAPPAVVFPIVWTVLYVDIAVCSAVVVDDLNGVADHTGVRDYFRALAVNLVGNAGWSWVGVGQ
jgi:tryptophan-rich sensory protein